MNFKSSEQLIARVSKSLNSYQAAGLLDEGDFHRWIKEILTKLNIPAYSQVHAILDLDGNTLAVPDDMYQLWAVWRYEELKQLVPEGLHYQRQTRWKVEKRMCLEHGCDDNCNSVYTEGDEDIMVVKEFVQDTGESRTRRFHSGVPIRVVGYELNQCRASSPSVTVKSSLTASLTNNRFKFNFTEGSVYLQYFALQVDEEGLPMVPDVTEIELAIETYIVFRFFQELYINSTVDIYQKLQYSEVKYREAYDVAKSWVKLPTARGLIDYAKKLQGRNNIFELKHARG